VANKRRVGTGQRGTAAAVSQGAKDGASWAGEKAHLILLFDTHHRLDSLRHDGNLGVNLELAFVLGGESNFGLRERCAVRIDEASWV